MTAHRDRTDPPAFASGTVPVDGTALSYRVAGDGPALVFLHAGVADARMWDGFAERFADRFRVVAYDLRGFGDSPHAPERFSHVGDLKSLLDELGAESAHLVGASMGGAVAVDFALASPERVESLALFAPAVSGYEFTDEATLDGWADAEAAFERGDHDEAARIELETWVAGPERSLDDIDPDLAERVREMLLRSYELDDEDAEEFGPDEPAIDRLGALATPTLVVVGAGDTSDTLHVARRIESVAPDARLEVVADAAHLPSVERPDAIARLLSTFLDDVSG